MFHNLDVYWAGSSLFITCHILFTLLQGQEQKFQLRNYRTSHNDPTQFLLLTAINHLRNLIWYLRHARLFTLRAQMKLKLKSWNLYSASNERKVILILSQYSLILICWRIIWRESDLLCRDWKENLSFKFVNAVKVYCKKIIHRFKENIFGGYFLISSDLHFFISIRPLVFLFLSRSLPGNAFHPE